MNSESEYLLGHIQEAVRACGHHEEEEARSVCSRKQNQDQASPEE
jgi:hypothetical protein